jgi:NADPH:quinone reductase-like Zn-dependent oxidoreductase
MIPEYMFAVVTRGVGGYDQLDYSIVPTPIPESGEVLVQVLAAGVNNTEINTRLGWYSDSVQSGTNQVSTEPSSDINGIKDGGWNQETPFPFIQGTDCFGQVVQADDNPALLGEKVLIRPAMRKKGFHSLDHWWMGSDFDGAFAQFVKVPASEVFPLSSDLSESQLGVIPCAYGTAENMLQRAVLKADDVVLVCGASGGVGTAAIQLAKIRGCKIIAITSESKIDAVKKLGANSVFDRNVDLIQELGERSIDLIIDNVAGEQFAGRIKLLRPGGRVVSSGAVAGPMVNMDLRDLYLRDLKIIGCTAWDEPVFPALVSYIKKGQIQPMIAGTYPLSEIAEAQKQLVSRNHVGKIVLIPPKETASI